MLPFLAVALFAAADAHVEVKDNPPGFALEPGFFEAVPGIPIVVVVDDAAPRDELTVDVVRIGPLGRDKAKLTVVVDGRARALTVVAVTEAERKVGKQFASLPVHQQVPLPTGSARVEIKVDEPMALKVGVARAPAATGDIPLVPLTDADAPPAPPAPPETTTTTPTTTPTTTTPPPPTTTTTTPTPPPATTTPAPVAPAPAPATVHDETTTTTPTKRASHVEESAWPKVYAEVHAGGSVLVNGLQALVPAGGARVMLGPRSLDAALGVALDFDGQGAFVPGGRWDAATTRVRLEGIIGLGILDLFDADLDLAVGAGLRITQHGAHGKSIRAEQTVLGGTLRVAPEGAFPAGPGDFLVAVPVDVSADFSDRVSNFAPLAAGVLLGYRLEL